MSQGLDFEIRDRTNPLPVADYSRQNATGSWIRNAHGGRQPGSYLHPSIKTTDPVSRKRGLWRFPAARSRFRQQYPFWAKDAKIGYNTINARAEDVASKPAFREALKKRRCLVPADAFYEWQRLDAKSKRPFAFALASGEPYAFAGLWESWRPKEGAPLETFTILTTDPNQLMEPIHNRMPVILEPKDYDRWLDPGDPARPPVDLLRPYAAERMKAWPVSDRVGNVRNNGPELLNAST